MTEPFEPSPALTLTAHAIAAALKASGIARLVVDYRWLAHRQAVCRAATHSHDGIRRPLPRRCVTRYEFCASAPIWNQRARCYDDAPVKLTPHHCSLSEAIGAWVENILSEFYNDWCSEESGGTSGKLVFDAETLSIDARFTLRFAPTVRLDIRTTFPAAAPGP